MANELSLDLDEAILRLAKSAASEVADSESEELDDDGAAERILAPEDAAPEDEEAITYG